MRGASALALASTSVAWALLSGDPAGAVSPEGFHGQPSLRWMEISPSGELLASVSGQRGWVRVAVRRRADSRGVTAFKRLSGIRRVQWIDDRHLLVLMGEWRSPSYRVVTVAGEGDRLGTREQLIEAPGRFVSLLPNQGEDVLWGVQAKGRSSVYRLPISALLAAGGRVTDELAGTPVARRNGFVDRWVADREGVVMAALHLERSRKSRLWYRRSKADEWRLLAESEDAEEMPIPLGVAENGRDLVVASSSGRDTMALLELSEKTGSLGRELFSRPDSDVTDVVYDYTGAVVIGAVIERDGLEEFHHFDSFFARYQRSLARAFPGAAVEMVSASRDRRYFVIVARSPRDPGTYYLLDSENNTAREVGRVMPGLDPDALSPVEALRITAAGGSELEAFLTRPKTEDGPPPLVVLPHGGPAGVRDTRHFDPLVQYLAAGGLAVLQVNYRGSSGRGRSFLDAGKRQWGTGIERDLEAAIDEVVSRGWVDGDRVCVAGGSYGGYSALMSVITRPERYRCAASINGPTDLPFLYHSNPAMHATREGREYFNEFIGDPEEGYESLLVISPAYRAAEIRVPVLLIHGTEDRRVDVDHFHRLQLALEALGKPHETHLLRGGGHVPSRSEWREISSRLRRFLLRHLEESQS